MGCKFTYNALMSNPPNIIRLWERVNIVKCVYKSTLITRGCHVHMSEPMGWLIMWQIMTAKNGMRAEGGSWKWCVSYMWVRVLKVLHMRGRSHITKIVNYELSYNIW